MSRPYFSVVIACYNDGRYAKGVYLDRLLHSLTDQGMAKEEVEIILADDCSPVPYDDIVEQYSDNFIIKRVKTDYNFAPGNTRAKGVTVATGEWLCFADHDDMFYGKALRQVRKGIQSKNEQYFAFTDFLGVDPDGKPKKKYEATLNWCHGKFYNLDNLWKAHNIHFIPDLKSHEDIAICTQVSCAFTNINNELTYLPFVSYAWTDNPQSVSHAKYYVEHADGPRYFLEVFFRDYLESTGYVYLEQYDKHLIRFRFAVRCCIEILVYCFVYTQGFQFRRPDFLYENLIHCGEFLNRVKRAFNLTNQVVYDAIAEDDAAIYRKIRPLADPGAGAYVPQQSLIEWIQLVDKAYRDSLQEG